ncbi:MAG: hypothetical protein LBT14_03535 [Treponema sp.]|nr:hypothetical protein [Treponema sp.]
MAENENIGEFYEKHDKKSRFGSTSSEIQVLVSQDSPAVIAQFILLAAFIAEKWG